MISGGAPVASLMISGGVSRPIGHRTNIVSVKKWGGQSPPNPPVPTPMVIMMCNQIGWKAGLDRK